MLAYLKEWGLEIIEDPEDMVEFTNQRVVCETSSELAVWAQDASGEVQKISLKELNIFKNKGKLSTAAYLLITDLSQLPLDNEIVQEGVYAWAAGLLWNKYYQKTGNSNLLEEDSTTYGDKLISRAKLLLKPFIKEKEDEIVPLVATAVYTIDRDVR